MNTIMVQMSGYSWTTAALHQACSLARRRSDQVALLWLIPVPPTLLGTTFGWSSANFDEWENLSEYRATAEDYDVELIVQSMQFVSFHEAIVQAACLLNAYAAFVDHPSTHIPFWDAIRISNLERRLKSVNCQLQTSDTAVGRMARPLP